MKDQGKMFGWQDKQNSNMTRIIHWIYTLFTHCKNEPEQNLTCWFSNPVKYSGLILNSINLFPQTVHWQLSHRLNSHLVRQIWWTIQLVCGVVLERQPNKPVFGGTGHLATHNSSVIFYAKVPPGEAHEYSRLQGRQPWANSHAAIRKCDFTLTDSSHLYSHSIWRPTTTQNNPQCEYVQ